ncbi:MAG: type II and III secretion system protein family protein [Rhodospirillales bacterium]|nr:type II and III secretion system protein family protein [Rhodospirillales bacterium]MBO6788741.1 type II and III secretion system protein family protein [Rhodospirillales bacterium]
MTPRRHFIRNLASIAVFAVALAMGGEVRAQALEVVSRGHHEMPIELNKGKLIKLRAAAQTVFVANPEIADVQIKSPTLVYVLGKAAGETTLFAVDRREQVLASIDLHVSHNLDKINQSIRTLHPNADVVLNSVGDTVVVDGMVDSVSTAENIRRVAAGAVGGPEKVLLRLGVNAPTQINLRVRVAEVSRDIDKQLGFNWSIAGSAAGIAFGIATSNPFNSSVTQHTLSASGLSIGGFDLNAVIDALEEEGLISVLAEPNLTALSGEAASFLAGGEFPILVPDSDGRVTIEFKKFGVSLSFTPTLIGRDRVNLHVRPEVSQLSTTNAVTLNNFQIPSLTTRRADTTVELGSGQSFAIAGLIQNNVTHDISKFPGLGDVPVLGGLFKSDRFQREESELVIIVTPYVVRPVSPNRLAAPTDGLESPHDFERIVNGGTHRQKPSAPQPVTISREGESLIGPVGFLLERDPGTTTQGDGQ